VVRAERLLQRTYDVAFRELSSSVEQRKNQCAARAACRDIAREEVRQQDLSASDRRREPIERGAQRRDAGQPSAVLDEPPPERSQDVPTARRRALAEQPALRDRARHIVDRFARGQTVKEQRGVSDGETARLEPGRDRHDGGVWWIRSVARTE
jgi:hypothetical protein